MIDLRVSEAAALAIIEQADYYRQALDDRLAARWENSVDEGIRSLLLMPERGTPCRFRLPQLVGLRWIPMKGFPKHMIFYRFDPDCQRLVVVDVLHGARDVMAILGQDDDEDATGLR